MSNEEKYFEVLSGAIAQINAESFEARGVVYDRLWQIILERLQDESDPSDESISNERAAFLAAVQRIEFGERLSAAAEQPVPAAREQPLPAASQEPWSTASEQAFASGGEQPLPAAGQEPEPFKPNKRPRRAPR